MYNELIDSQCLPMCLSIKCLFPTVGHRCCPWGPQQTTVPAFLWRLKGPGLTPCKLGVGGRCTWLRCPSHTKSSRLDL